MLSKDAPLVLNLFTQGERVWDADETGACRKANSIRREFEDSLRRLQTDVIDLYQIHWPEPDEDIEEVWAAELAPAEGR